jgi:glycosyltransferase involved in cell wall biosynthesis
MLLYKLLSSIDRTRFASTVISLKPAGDVGPMISSLDVPVYDLSIEGVVGGFRGLRRAASLIRAMRPHVIQTWLHHADLFGTVAARLSGNSNLVWSLQCASLSATDVPRRNLHLVRVLGVLSALPRVVISVSEAGRLAHSDAGYHPRRWEVIPNCFDTRSFSPDMHARARVRARLSMGEHDALIGIIGRYHPMKGHALFLQAAKKLTEKRPDVMFVMAGKNVDERNQELTERIDDLGLAHNVRLLGMWPDMPELMNAFDILAVSSTSEGFPTVLGEAMACGVPCVATDVGDCRAVIAETGRVVVPGDPGALAGAWEELLNLPVRDRRELGRAARERICSSYGIDVIVARYQNLYEELADAT